MNSSYFSISIWRTFIDTCYRSQSHIIWNTLTYTIQIRGVSGSLHLAALPQPKETKIRGGSNPIRCGYNGHQNVYVLEMGSLGSLGSHEKKKHKRWKGRGQEGSMQNRISEYLGLDSATVETGIDVSKKISLNPLLTVAVWHRRYKCQLDE